MIRHVTFGYLISALSAVSYPKDETGNASTTEFREGERPRECLLLIGAINVWNIAP